MRFGVLAAIVLGVSSFAVLPGCDRELARETEIDVDDNTVKREDKVIKERPDGTIVKEESETKSVR